MTKQMPATSRMEGYLVDMLSALVPSTSTVPPKTAVERKPKRR